MKQTIYIPVKVEEGLPPKRKEITDYSIRVIGVFSETLVDYVHYNYHTKKWSFSDGDNYGTLEMKHWLKPVEMPTEDQIKEMAIKEFPNDEDEDEEEIMETDYARLCYTIAAKAIIALMKGEK